VRTQTSTPRCRDRGAHVSGGVLGRPSSRDVRSAFRGGGGAHRNSAPSRSGCSGTTASSCVRLLTCRARARRAAGGRAHRAQGVHIRHSRRFEIFTPLAVKGADAQSEFAAHPNGEKFLLSAYGYRFCSSDRTRSTYEYPIACWATSWRRGRARCYERSYVPLRTQDREFDKDFDTVIHPNIRRPRRM